MTNATHRRRSPARDRLVEAASQLFYQEGLNRVGVERIIETAGVARMTFYRHFPSKTDLVETVLEERSKRISEWLIEETNASVADPYQRLLVMFDKLENRLAVPGFRGCAALNFASEVADSDSRVSDIARRHKETERQYIEDNARAAGLANPAELSHTLMLLMNGALSLGQLQNSPEPARHARRTAERLVEEARPPQVREESA